MHFFYSRVLEEIAVNRCEFLCDALICCRHSDVLWCVRRVSNAIRLIQEYLVRKYTKNLYVFDAESLRILFSSNSFSPFFAFAAVRVRRILCF